ncbi:hypothetical protein [Thalassospira lucentensis]|uniref:DUF4136 domain-containing protein n=1 Tax=Thalassospira lucentensis TaxID=168935 RepID=A0A358HW23_9PROT|nr:hypothetical protein [Thalassospira lucentensis]HBU98994.1 hypothetical protein [Thalassospira lucentensis]HCW69729.1 hypothetical protein [Thalassospira lucentensis]
MKYGLRILTLSVAGAMALSLGACSSGIQDQVVGGSALLGEAKVGALSTTASYRTVVAKFDSTSRVCPEPPPDVAVAITSSLLAQIDAGQGDIKANATVARSVAEKVAPLLKRTSALQFYRDARSYNCFAYMNNVTSPGEYVAADQAAMDSATMLMALEIIKGTDQELPSEIEAKINDAIENKVAEITKATLDKVFPTPPTKPAEAPKN